jgi:hypothetical protein
MVDPSGIKAPIGEHHSHKYDSPVAVMAGVIYGLKNFQSGKGVVKIAWPRKRGHGFSSVTPLFYWSR